MGQTKTGILFNHVETLYVHIHTQIHSGMYARLEKITHRYK